MGRREEAQTPAAPLRSSAPSAPSAVALFPANAVP
jgi:hypothetical protein